MRLLVAVLLALVCLTMAVGSAVAQDPETQQPQGSTVGNGDGPPPSIASAVRKRAKAGKCKLRSFASEGVQHGEADFVYATTPATSGTHAGRWADWGAYDTPVPDQYLVHNLEHGGVTFHFGNGMSQTQLDRLARFVAAEPGYVVVTPRASDALVPAESGVSAFPESGFVVTSWQRRLVCRRASRKAVSAAIAYIRRYRGTGREQVPAFNSTQGRPADLPAPTWAPAPPA